MALGTALAIGGGLIASGLASYFGTKSAAEAKSKAIEQAQNANNEAARERFLQVAELLDKVQQPNFNYRSLAPEEFSVVGEFAPQVAQYVAEQDPTFVRGISEDAKQSREVQKQVLRDFLESARGEDVQSQIEAQRAVDRTLQTSRGIDEQILQSMARRGAAGSGLELAARLAGAQRGTSQLAQAQQQAASDAARRRLQALAQSGSMAGDIRREEIGREKTNADILNAFNRRSAARLQEQRRYAAGLQNQSQLRNLQERQRVDEKNVAQRNLTDRAERDRLDRMERERADFDMRRAQTLAGAAPQDRYQANPDMSGQAVYD